MQGGPSYPKMGCVTDVGTAPGTRSCEMGSNPLFCTIASHSDIHPAPPRAPSFHTCSFRSQCPSPLFVVVPPPLIQGQDGKVLRMLIPLIGSVVSIQTCNLLQYSRWYMRCVYIVWERTIFWLVTLVFLSVPSIYGKWYWLNRGDLGYLQRQYKIISKDNSKS